MNYKNIYNYDTFNQMEWNVFFLYFTFLIHSDVDGICDTVHKIMKDEINQHKQEYLDELVDKEFVYFLDEQNKIIWLPDKIAIMEIEDTTDFEPSPYRKELRERYPWAPLLVVRDASGKIRKDIINHNDILDPDPRTCKFYKTPTGQRPNKLDMEDIGINEFFED